MLVRPVIASLSGYVPGEQPQNRGWTKLNTNENPYPPSPRVAEAIQEAASRLQVYPDPSARSFREAAAAVYDIDPAWILPANGSDESLMILIRTFVDPHETISFPYPGYVLYQTLAGIQGSHTTPLLLDADWQMNDDGFALAAYSKLCLVPVPNSPSGTTLNQDTLQRMIPDTGLLVLDGAYADFAAAPLEPGMLCQRDLRHRVVMTRTMSKSYSLAGLRFGFTVAHPDLIAQMQKVKDSYNCDTLSIAAATAAIQDQDWMIANRNKIIATRTRAVEQFEKLGFRVTPSDANFLWMVHQELKNRSIYEALKQRQILIRYMEFPLVSYGDSAFDGLRVTIGTDAEIDTLLDALRQLL